MLKNMLMLIAFSEVEEEIVSSQDARDHDIYDLSAKK